MERNGKGGCKRWVRWKGSESGDGKYGIGKGGVRSGGAMRW